MPSAALLRLENQGADWELSVRSRRHARNAGWMRYALIASCLFLLVTEPLAAGGIATTIEVIQQPRFTLFQNFKVSTRGRTAYSG